MRYRFASFVLDADRFELTRDGVAVRAEPQVIELLLLLIERRDRMVSKDDILQIVWQGRPVSEATLSGRIKLARQALDDDGRGQHCIRTVHGKGFRFVAEVVEDEGRNALSMAVPEGKAASPEPGDAHASRPSVAVLPFANLSEDPKQEYFSDGISADMIAQLSKYRWMDVIARNTTFGFKGRAVDVREIGALLGAHYVVEGGVQRLGKRVRISAQLIDARSGHCKWSERHEQDIFELFAMQDEIIEKLVARLEPEIGHAERRRAVQSRPVNLQAWDCYHLGLFSFYRFTSADNAEALRLLSLCRELDPQFADAHAWWAYALVLDMVYWDTRPTPQAIDEALAACDQALAIDPCSASLHAIRARVLVARCKYDEALRENRTAISFNPSLAVAYCGLGDSLAYEMRYDEALASFEHAIALSPNDPQVWAFYTYGALALLFKHDFAAALEWTERAGSMPNHQYWTTAHRCVALAHLGQIEEARSMGIRLLREHSRFSRAFAREKLFYLKEPAQVALYLQGLGLAGIPD